MAHELQMPTLEPLLYLAPAGSHAQLAEQSIASGTTVKAHELQMPTLEAMLYLALAGSHAQLAGSQ